MKPLVTPADAVALALLFSRIIALMMAFPFFNTNMIPLNVKILLVVSFSFFILRLTGVEVDMARFSWPLFVMLLLKEFLLGFILGILTNIFIAAFGFAAEIVSYFMGFTVVNNFDPTFGQVSVLSHFFIMLFYLLFFVTGAYQFFISSIVLSLEYVPLFSLSFHQGIWAYIVELSGYIFVLAFKLSFPFALILYVVNLALALVNRLIPQINVFIVGLPMQIFIGLAALGFGAAVIVYMGADFLVKMADEYLYVIKHLG
ncbi:MAG: flagellar biosynthetic protein FliR [Epsilonproteobacteria bacterium]|nr:flagellar biosynthetic protein FliR [Campylobacterota bacterium]